MHLNEYLEQLRRVYRPTGGGTLAPPGPPPDDRDVPRGGGETAEGAPGTGDHSVEGLIGLHNALNDPTSVQSLTLGLMGALAGPLGSLAMSGVTLGAPKGPAGVLGGLRGMMAADVSAKLNAISQNTPVGIRGLNADDNADDPNDPVGVVSAITANEDTASAAAAAAAAASAANSAPPGPTGAIGETAYHGGGVVRDRRPGLEEPITAQQGEYVVARGPAKRFRTLLEAINEGDVPAIKAQARTLKERLTR